MKDRLYILIEATKEAIKESKDNKTKEVLQSHLDYINALIK